MINQHNIAEVVSSNLELLSKAQIYVDKVQEINIAFKYSPVEAIKNYLTRETNLIMFPSKDPDYGGLVTYKNGRYYVHINTNQPKPYENFIWAHEFYHFFFEKEEIKNSKVHTFADGTSPNENERLANLFASELLINKQVLEATYKELRQIYTTDKLENYAIRLIQTFKVPYKCIVIKLAQDGLISLPEATAIIDYDYRNHLPSDFDNTLLNSSNSIQFNSVRELLNDETIKENLRASDYKSILTKYDSLMSLLGGSDR